MKKRLALACIFLILSSSTAPAFSIKTNIECTHGNYKGWHVWVERNSMKDTQGTFHFDNETGQTAFRIKVIVNFLDYFGNFIDPDKSISRAKAKNPGPLHNDMSIIFESPFPPETSKFSCEIYWSDQEKDEDEDKD